MSQIDLADLNDYRYFVRVIEAGGFSAAARRLGIPKSRLSRRIAGLEARLGVRLIQRSTRKLTLTDAGQRVLVHSEALLHEAEAAGAVAASLKAEPNGLVRVSTPSVLVDSGLAKVFEAFLHAYPKVALETVLSGHRVDLIEEGIDVALRVRPSYDEDPQWPTLRLVQYHACLVASPALLAAYPLVRTPADLASLPALGGIEADRRVHWRLVGPGDERRDIAVAPRLASDHFGLRLRALLSGLGVGMMPEPLVRTELAAGLLVEVLPQWRFPPVCLQAVYASQRGLSPAVRALLDFLQARLPDAKQWIDRPAS